MESDSQWEFNAPVFVDFSGGNSLTKDDNADDYFDFDHENGVPVVKEFENDTMDGTIASEVFTTPQSEVKRVTRSNKTPIAVVLKNSLADTKTPESQVIKPMRETRSTCKKTAITAAMTVPVEAPVHTPSPRVTRTTKQHTPNTVEKEYAEEQRSKSQPRNTEVMVKTTLESKPTKRQHKSVERSQSMAKKSKPSVPERGRTPNKSTTTSNLHRSSSFSTLHHNKGQGSEKKGHSRGYSGGQAMRVRSGSASSGKSDTDNMPASTKKGGVVPMTIPTTPTCMKRKPLKLITHQPVKNSEELEMEKIAFFKQELAKSRKLAQESCKTALSGKGGQPCNPVIKAELTKPQSFKFQTDSRLKMHGMETRHHDVKDFADILRSNKGQSQTSSSAKSGPTKPEPFHFTHPQRKRKLPDMEEKQAEKYETMAEKLKAFTATPERFRSKPKGGSSQTRGRSRSPPGMTIPKTPQFETRTRSRPVTAPSRQDIEQKEYETQQKNQFKAKPMNPKIFTNSSCGVKKVASKPATKTEAFHLSGDRRMEKKHERHDSDHYEFHAQPLDKKILEGTVGLKEARKIPVTIPESPAFALKNRVRITAEVESQEDKPHLRTRAMPHFGIPFQPQLQHRVTEPTPFGFEERDKRRSQMKAQKIEQVYEEEIKDREFYANPLPSFEAHLPAKKTRPLTNQQPFNLDTETRGKQKANEWSHKIEEELRLQKEKARFRANPPNVLDQEPFIPAKENKCTTDISEFELNTTKRVMKREIFEMHKKSKQDQLDDIRHQEQLMKDADERMELENLRREAVHKANPVKHYKKMKIKRSEKPLTAPMSPHFKTDTRLRARGADESSIMSI